MAHSWNRHCTKIVSFCRRCRIRLSGHMNQEKHKILQTTKSPSVLIYRPLMTSSFKNQRHEADCQDHRNQRKRERPVVTNTMDEEELETFIALAQSWWDETGDFEALHAMNKLRVPFIRDGLLGQREDIPADLSLPLQGLKIVDAGCGGGLLAEPLARLGAFVVGVDPVEESTKVAQLHLEEDPAIMPRVKYITGTIEDLVVTEAEMFDAVVASEVIEHVADLVMFIETCCKLIKPGGSVFFTTINKTQMSKGLAVFAAEKVFRVVPSGTHDWEKFVPPEDLQMILERNDVDTRKIHGMFFNPVSREWSWMQDTNINYALHGVKHDHIPPDNSHTADSEATEHTDRNETQPKGKSE